jgi:hypothetical protein
MFPSRVKVGEPSFADPETTPGANIIGASPVTGAAKTLPKKESRKTAIARRREVPQVVTISCCIRSYFARLEFELERTIAGCNGRPLA